MLARNGVLLCEVVVVHTFLSSIAATVGETRERMSESAVEDDEQAVEPSSLGMPKVLLRRVQLRAVTPVYECPPVGGSPSQSGGLNRTV